MSKPYEPVLGKRIETKSGETLTCMRTAYKQKDGADGFLYVHAWKTGFQELVFPSHEAAGKLIDRMNSDNYRNLLNQKA